MPTLLVLHPCKIRETRFVPDRRAVAVSHDWDALAARFLGHLEKGSEARRNAARALRALTRQSFVGLATARDSDVPHLFVFQGDGGVSDFRAVVARDETFASRVTEVYRVESVQWDVTREEAEGNEPFKPVHRPADHVVHAQA
jgi:hypothetical protein